MPLPHFIGVTELRKSLFRLIEIAQRRRLDIPYIVTSHGKPVAKVVFFRRGTTMRGVLS
jgi:prevent-host-death family protein